jgi:hypothetical protein
MGVARKMRSVAYFGSMWDKCDRLRESAQLLDKLAQEVVIHKLL